MAASTVLSVILLLMIGMQDQMSKAWSNANRRTESTREARAGLRMMTEDFVHYYIRANLTSSAYRSSYNPRTNSIPLIYFTNAARAIGSFSIPSAQNNSQAVFFLSQRRPRSDGQSDRLEAVGYYIASAVETNINGFVSTNFHLFRYINTNVLPNLQQYLANTSSIQNLFPRVGPSASFVSNNEILARNSLNLRIYFYPSTQLPNNGIIQDFPIASDNSYTGNRCVFELTSYPENVANSLLQGGASMSAWTNTNNLKRFGRTFEITMDLERGL